MLLEYGDWDYISRDGNFSIEFGKKFADEIDWHELSFCSELSDEFIEKFADKLEINILAEERDFSPELLRRIDGKFKYSGITEYQNIPEDLLEKHINEFDEIDWLNMGERYKLSENFIKKHLDKFNISDIKRYQKHLSKKFLDSLADDDGCEGQEVIIKGKKYKLVRDG